MCMCLCVMWCGVIMLMSTILITIVVNFGRFPAMMNCSKLGIPLRGIFLSVNITYNTIAKE